MKVPGSFEPVSQGASSIETRPQPQNSEQSARVRPSSVPGHSPNSPAVDLVAQSQVFGEALNRNIQATSFPRSHETQEALTSPASLPRSEGDAQQYGAIGQSRSVSEAESNVNSVSRLYTEATATVGNLSAEGELETGVLRQEHQGHIDDNGVFGGAHELNLVNATVEGHLSIDQGVGLRVDAEARVAKQEGSLFVGKDANNPILEVGAAYDLAAADLKSEALLGSDGKRTGLALGGYVGASAATGGIKAELNFPVPFTDLSVSVKAKSTVSVGAISAGGGGHAYFDHENNRLHVGVGADAAVLIGLEGNFDLSIGPKFDTRDRPSLL